MFNIELKEFQEECVNELLLDMGMKNKEVILKSPTASGKTIILADFIDKYLMVDNSIVFVWLSTGKGELEEQSKKKFEKYLPQRNTKDLDDVLQNGFSKEDIAFMNWESITKTGNKAIKEQEKKNLYEKIEEAIKSGIRFKIIIDEEHVNKTEKADNLLKFFKSNKIIRVSATPKISNHVKLIEIDERDVINSGLITRNLFINEKVSNEKVFDDDTEYLLDLAIDKQKQIKEEYKKIDMNVNPLILIQFASESPLKIKKVEDILKEKGYTYDNKRVGIWLSEEKKNIQGIEQVDNSVIFLLMKQAISTGWDCPRAKILVKLRDNMAEDFEIQTIGRIRRTINGTHYDNILLDSCYLYTFDSKYVNEVKQKYNGVETKILYLKEEYNNFKLIKQLKNPRHNQYGAIEALKLIREHFKEKYKLVKDKDENMKILEIGDYKFEKYIVNDIAKDVIQGEVDEKTIEDIHKFNVSFQVDTHRNGIDFQHSINVLRKEIGLSYNQTRTIFERLFCPRKNAYYKTTLVNLNIKNFYAFIINNEERLKYELRECVQAIQQHFSISKEDEFKIPKKCLVKYYSNSKDVQEIINNVYDKYTTDIIRSGPETKFENYCQQSECVEWVYKNGESSKEYFSLVYEYGNKQYLFYPDYIIKANDEIWIIETKGGENKSGQSKNIDKKASHKFNVLKKYAEEKGIKWGFVRDYDKNDKLYLNNTIYTEDMSSDNWISLDKFF